MGGEVLSSRKDRRRSVRRRTSSVLLRKSLQDGVHLLRNGRQRKLKLILQAEKQRDERKEVRETCWNTTSSLLLQHQEVSEGADHPPSADHGGSQPAGSRHDRTHRLITPGSITQLLSNSGDEGLCLGTLIDRKHNT